MSVCEWYRVLYCVSVMRECCSHSLGAWKDFAAAQSILELLDTLWMPAPPSLVKASVPADLYSMPSPGAVHSPAELENTLYRLALRLTLYSLHETDTFFCSEVP